MLADLPDMVTGELLLAAALTSYPAPTVLMCGLLINITAGRLLVTTQRKVPILILCYACHGQADGVNLVVVHFHCFTYYILFIIFIILFYVLFLMRKHFFPQIWLIQKNLS